MQISVDDHTFFVFIYLLGFFRGDTQRSEYFDRIFLFQLRIALSSDQHILGRCFLLRLFLGISGLALYLLDLLFGVIGFFRVFRNMGDYTVSVKGSIYVFFSLFLALIPGL